MASNDSACCAKGPGYATPEVRCLHAHDLQMILGAMGQWASSWVTSPVLICRALVQDAIHGPRETLLYVPAIVPEQDRPDYLCTVDADPTSSSYSQVGPAAVWSRCPCHSLVQAMQSLHGWCTTFHCCSSCHSVVDCCRSFTGCPCPMLVTSSTTQVSPRRGCTA